MPSNHWNKNKTKVIAFDVETHLGIPEKVEPAPFSLSGGKTQILINYHNNHISYYTLSMGLRCQTLCINTRILSIVLPFVLYR